MRRRHRALKQPHNEMGAGIAASPHRAEHGYAGVLVPDRPKPHRLSILAHQLRRRFPPSLVRRPPAMFHGPSWDDHFRVPLCPHHSEEQLEPRRAKGRSSLPAPLPGLASDRVRRPSPLPAGRDRNFGHCRSVLPEGRRVRLRPEHHAHRHESRKAKNRCPSLWITGISGTTVGTFPDSRESRLAIA